MYFKWFLAILLMISHDDPKWQYYLKGQLGISIRSILNTWVDKNGFSASLKPVVKRTLCIQSAHYFILKDLKILWQNLCSSLLGWFHTRILFDRVTYRDFLGFLRFKTKHIENKLFNLKYRTTRSLCINLAIQRSRI